MEIKHKGKIHPSPSSSPPSSSSSVFKLLPTAILALVSLLSLDDREVLAYMIARSIQSSAFTSTRVSRKKSTRKASINGGNGNVTTTTYHKTPMFSCDCFYCYTAYWCRWDSSPNRELIHQAIEAFEDHLTNGEKPKKNNGRGKRRDRIGRQETGKTLPVIQCPPPVADECVDVPLLTERGPTVEAEGSPVKEVEESGPVEEVGGGGDHEKGLGTKVLPDVLGFLNSRLWSLWSPNL